MRPQVGEGGSIYRTPQGFRSSGDLARDRRHAPSSPPAGLDRALLDSANYSLPDTSEFTLKDYRVHFSPDYIARPSIGYARDNFGRGFFGGSAISLSDILGNHQLVFAGYVNGRINEAQVLAAYANLSKRINWAVGVSQDPVLLPRAERDRRRPRAPGDNIFITNIRRLVVRSVFGQAYYPVSRFQRIEGALRFANVDDALLQINEPYDPATGLATEDPFLETNNLPGVNYVQPSAALVFDNSLFGYVGPFYGRRYRLEFAQTLGDWRFSQVTADYRRYDQIIGPIVLATRALYFGRIGRDARAVPDLRRQHRPDPRQHLGLLPAERVPQRQRSQHRDRLCGARPAGRHPDRRRQRRDALPDPQPIVRPARRRSRRSKAPSSTTSAWRGTTRARSSGAARPATTRSASGRR